MIYRLKKEKSVTFQPFHCLTLDINTISSSERSCPQSHHHAAPAAVSLQGALRRYFSEEMIDDGNVRKLLRVEALPEVLVLQLNRFSYDYYRDKPVKVRDAHSCIVLIADTNTQLCATLGA